MLVCAIFSHCFADFSGLQIRFSYNNESGSVPKFRKLPIRVREIPLNSHNNYIYSKKMSWNQKVSSYIWINTTSRTEYKISTATIIIIRSYLLKKSIDPDLQLCLFLGKTFLVCCEGWCWDPLLIAQQVLSIFICYVLIKSNLAFLDMTGLDWKQGTYIIYGSP